MPERTMTIKRGTLIECNQCQHAFRAPADQTAMVTENAQVYRLSSFCACPSCGRTDCHWAPVKNIDAPLPVYNWTKRGARESKYRTIYVIFEAPVGDLVNFARENGLEIARFTTFDGGRAAYECASAMAERFGKDAPQYWCIAVI